MTTGDAMEAGRELDALVAKKVMGWKSHPVGNFPWQLMPPGGDGYKVECCPHYSADIGAGWAVANKIVESDIDIVMELLDYGPSDNSDERYCCSFGKEAPRMAGAIEWGVEGWGGTAPLAICRAALKAVQEQERV